jgi:hypothetical protein
MQNRNRRDCVPETASRLEIPLRSNLKLAARPVARLTALVLMGATATCVEQPTPTAPQDTAPPNPRATAALVSTSITQTLLASGNSPLNGKGYTTATISPSPNTLITVAVLGHNATAATASPTLTGGGMTTWTEVASTTFDIVAIPHKRLTIFRAMSASPGSGPLTITWSVGQSNCQWIVSQWDGVDMSGTNGAGAIGQTGSASANTAAGLTVTMGGLGSTANVAYGVFGVTQNVLAVTPGAGFAEIAEQPSGESTKSDIEAEWATNDNTIDASWTRLNGAMLGVEIKSDGGSGGISPSLSTLTSSSGSIAAGGAPATITAIAKDATGNPVSGATVVLSASGTGNSLTQPAGPTDASGVATGTLGSTVAQTKTVSAAIGGTPIAQTATVQVTAQRDSAIAQTLLASGNSPTNGKVFTTAALSPDPNTLVTVAVMGHNTTGASASPTLSGGGMSAWTEVASITYDAVATPHKRLTIFRAMSAAPGSGPLTITFSIAQSNCQWIVSQWEGVDISGTNGSGSIGQTGTTSANSASGLTIALGALGGTSNVAYGVFGVNQNVPVITPGSGYSEIAEQPSGETPQSDLEAEWATNDNTIDATWNKLNGAGLGVEIRSSNSGPVTPVATVDVSPNSATVAVGATVQLSAATKDAGGEPLTGRTITWGTSSAQIATVSTSGLVTGVAAGSATITATSEGKSGTASVVVTSTTVPVATVEVTPASASMPVGGTLQLTATPKDAADQPLTGRTITWATSAAQVATVSTAGLVRGVGTGSATITATSEGKDGTSSVTVTSQPLASLVGQWSSVISAPGIQLHASLLFDGRVLTWGHFTDPQVWDPATGSFTAVPSPAVLFCAGHTFLSDGRLLVSGGHISDSHGLPNTTIFDPLTTTWQSAATMALGRWYPTTTTLPDGQVLTIGGQDETGAVVRIPEVWDGSSWRQLTSANLSLLNYPRTFVAPDGRIFYAGADQQSRWLDVSGTGSWTMGPQMNYGSRTYGSAVMYEPGKILYAGGSNPPTNTAEIIDLNQPSPQWSYTGSMAYARWNTNATLLPTGDVLVTGGTSDGNRANPAGAVYAAELWSSSTGTWKEMASNAVFRGYHSTSLLLPDGRVLHTGGGDGGGTPNNYNYEIYSPPYLFQGAPPSVTGSTPGTAGYGQMLSVQTPDGASIIKVNFIRFGSVTHAFNQAQLLIPLGFSQVGGGLSITLPSSHTAAPPGPYLLFLVNGNGVPSIGRIIRLQ